MEEILQLLETLEIIELDLECTIDKLIFNKYDNRIDEIRKEIRLLMLDIMNDHNFIETWNGFNKKKQDK